MYAPPLPLQWLEQNPSTSRKNPTPFSSLTMRRKHVCSSSSQTWVNYCPLEIWWEPCLGDSIFQRQSVQRRLSIQSFPWMTGPGFLSLWRHPRWGGRVPVWFLNRQTGVGGRCPALYRVRVCHSIKLRWNKHGNLRGSR